MTRFVSCALLVLAFVCMAYASTAVYQLSVSSQTGPNLNLACSVAPVLPQSAKTAPVVSTSYTNANGHPVSVQLQRVLHQVGGPFIGR